jgi:integrase/recombinase XerD
MSRRPKQPVAPNLGLLLPSWQLSLRADRKSEQTLKAYSDGVRFYLDWCALQQAAPLEPGSIRAWVTALLDKGNQPATARTRQLAVRRFTSWLTEEGELDADPFLGVKAPKLDTKVTEPLDSRRAAPPAQGLHPTEGLNAGRDDAPPQGRGDPWADDGERCEGR